MNANLLEKIFLTATVTMTVGLTGYLLLKKPNIEKQDIFKIRQELVKNKDVKMLYSTMSFFYLQGFKSKSPESFYTLQTILDIDIPTLIALPISKEQFQEKYKKARTHPRFRDAIDTFKFNVKNKKTDEILNVKDFNLKNLEILYLIDHCYSLKKCKIVYARREKQIYQKLDEAYKKLPKKKQEGAINATNAQIQDYAESLIVEMKPQMTFALSPQSPFKNIVGIVEPELLEGVTKKWKEKFKQHYSHVVMEDEEVLLNLQKDNQKEKEFTEKFSSDQKNK